MAGVLVIGGALYANQISRRWVPRADATVRAAQVHAAQQALAGIETRAHQNPGSAQAQLALAHALADRQQFMAALLSAERALQVEPGSAEAHTLAGMICASLGYKTDALEHYRHAIRKDPAGLDAYQGLGELLAATGDEAGARAVFLAAEQRAPTIVGPRMSLAQSYLDAGQAAAALDALDPVLRDPRANPGALLLGSKACQSVGQIDRGKELLRRAIQAQPGMAEAYHTLAMIDTNAGQYTEGVQLLNKAVSLAPDNAGYYYDLGNALVSDTARPDRLEAARHAFEQSLDRDPSAAYAHYYYGVTLEQMGETNAALREYQQTLVVSPGFGSAYYRLAAVFTTLGRKDEAKRYYALFDRESKKAIEQVHDQRRDNSILDTAQAHFQRGMLFMHTGMRKKAAADFAMALQRDPNFSPARQELQALGGTR